MSEINYNPFDFDIDQRAHDVWRQMRDQAPLYRNDEHDFWALTRYDDVLDGLLDLDTYSSKYGTVLDMMSDTEFGMPMFIFRDPPEHTLLRKLVSRAFTPRKMDGLEARINEICDELLGPLDGLSAFDFVEQFAALLPPTVILSLLGFPPGLERAMIESADASLALDENLPIGTHRDPSVIDATGNLGSAVFDQIPELCAQRREHPTDDLLTVLATHEREMADGSTRLLDHGEIFAYSVLIASAGTETVARMLGWAVALLAEHPAQRAQLAADSSLIPNAVEEILRFEAPSPVQGRRLMRDVEIHGRTVPEGSNMLLINGSGNRDERHFDKPDQFDIRRKIDRHLSFGYGAHFCIGAALARLEGVVGLEQILRRFGEWEVTADEVEWVHTSTVRGYKSVPVTL